MSARWDLNPGYTNTRALSPESSTLPNPHPLLLPEHLGGPFLPSNHRAPALTSFLLEVPVGPPEVTDLALDSLQPLPAGGLWGFFSLVCPVFLGSQGLGTLCLSPTRA